MPTLGLKRCYNFKVKTNLGYLKVQDLARLFTYLRAQVSFNSICIHFLKSYIGVVSKVGHRLQLSIHCFFISQQITPFPFRPRRIIAFKKGVGLAFVEEEEVEVVVVGVD